MNLRKRVYKTGGEAWVVDLGEVAGRRIQKAFKTKDDAKVWLQQKKLERDNLGRSAALLQDKDRLEFVHAKEMLAPYGADIMKAARFFAETHAASSHQMTFKDAAADLLKTKKTANKKPRYLAALRYTLSAVERDFGDKTVGDLTARHSKRHPFRLDAALFSQQSQKPFGDPRGF